MSDADDIKSLLETLMGRLAEKTGGDAGAYGQQLEAGIDRLKKLLSSGDLPAARQSAASTLQKIQQAMGVVSEVVQALASTVDTQSTPLVAVEGRPAAAIPPENNAVAWSAAYSSALARDDGAELNRLAALDASFLVDGSTFGDIVSRMSASLVDHSWDAGLPLIRLLAGTMLNAADEEQTFIQDGLVACFTVLARHAGRKGRIDDAVNYANRARDVAPDAPMVHAVRAEIHIAAGQLGAAERKVELALKQDPDCTDAWVVKGMCAAAKQDISRAQRCYNRAAELLLRGDGDGDPLDPLLRPSPASLLRCIARLAADNQRDTVALLAMEQLDSDYQNEAEWPEQIQDARLRAECLRRLGRNEEAASALCDASERMGWMGSLKEAEGISREAVELAPTHKRSWSLRAHLLVLRSYDETNIAHWLSESRRCAELVRELSAPVGMGPYAMRTWAAIEERAADVDTAVHAQKKWEAVAWVERAWLLDGAGGYQGALLSRQLRNAGALVLGRREAQRAYRVEPIADLAREEYLIGAVNFGDYEAAEEVLDTMSTEPWVQSVRVVVLLRTGHHDDARKLVDTLLMGGSTKLATWQTEAFAQCLERTGSADAAHRLRTDIWDRRTGISDLPGLAEIGLNLGHVDEAMKLLDRYEDGQSNRGGTARLRGMALLRKGLLAEGTSLLREMIDDELNPEELVTLAVDLDRLANDLESLDIKTVLTDLHAMLDARARTLILTDLVTAELDALPAADAGMIDPRSLAVRLVRARYAAEAGRRDEATDRYLSLAVDVPDAREIADALLASVDNYLQAGTDELDAAVMDYSAATPTVAPDVRLDAAIAVYERASTIIHSVPGWPSGLTGRPDDLLIKAHLGAALGLALRTAGTESISHLQSAFRVSGIGSHEVGERLGLELGGLMAKNPGCYWVARSLWRQAAATDDAVMLVNAVVDGASSVFDRFLGSGQYVEDFSGIARVRVFLGRDHLPEQPDNEEWPLLGQLLPELRARVGEAAGVRLPVVRLVDASDNLAADEFAVQLDGQMVTLGNAFASGTAGQRPVLEHRTKHTPATVQHHAPLDPLTGEPWPWTGPAQNQTSAVDTGSVPSQRFLARTLGACLAQRLGAFIGPDVVTDAVNSVHPGSETEFAATVASLSTRGSVDWIERLMRDLAADGYPTGLWRETPRWPPGPCELITTLNGALDSELATAADRVRAAFRERLAGNDGRTLVALDDRDSSVLAQICREPLEPAELVPTDFTPGEIADEVTRLTERHGWCALVVRDPATRRALRNHFRCAGVYLPVLTQDEALHPIASNARTRAAK